jgi:hypothetical protein
VNTRQITAVWVWAFCVLGAGGAASGAELWLASQQAFPGKIWQLDGSGTPQLSHQRNPTADAAFPTAVMKVGQVAAAPDEAFYFCSGLDGNVLSLLSGRHEVLSFEFAGQIRDLSCGNEEHAVYFSVVPTPQNGAPLADGKIYRRDIWQGAPTEVATIRQTDVGGAWWGAFTVRDGVITLVTTEPTSKLYRLTGSSPEPVFTNNTRRIVGIEAEDGHYLVVDGDGQVLKTADFTNFEPVYQGTVRATDVTARIERAGR